MTSCRLKIFPSPSKPCIYEEARERMSFPILVTRMIMCISLPVPITSWNKDIPSFSNREEREKEKWRNNIKWGNQVVPFLSFSFVRSIKWSENEAIKIQITLFTFLCMQMRKVSFTFSIVMHSFSIREERKGKHPFLSLVVDVRWFMHVMLPSSLFK